MIFHSSYRLIIKQLQISAYLVALFFGVFFDRWGYSTSTDVRLEWIVERSAFDHVG